MPPKYSDLKIPYKSKAAEAEAGVDELIDEAMPKSNANEKFRSQSDQAQGHLDKFLTDKLGTSDAGVNTAAAISTAADTVRPKDISEFIPVAGVEKKFATALEERVAAKLSNAPKPGALQRAEAAAGQALVSTPISELRSETQAYVTHLQERNTEIKAYLTKRGDSMDRMSRGTFEQELLANNERIANRIRAELAGKGE